MLKHWNRLGSLNQITNSELGANLTQSGIVYGAVKYAGGGGVLSWLSNAYIYLFDTMPNECTIDFFYKPNFASTTTAAEFPYIFSFYKNAPITYYLLCDIRSGLKEWKLVWPNTTATGFISTSLNFTTAWAANDVLEIRYKYNSAGLASGNYQELYVNKTLQTFKSGNALTTPIYGGTLDGYMSIMNAYNNTRGGRGYADNIKIYDKELTTFETFKTESLSGQRRRHA